jgi:glycerate kinase
VPRLLAAPDKFKGTATAAALAAAMAAGARSAGWTATELPMSDGGDGLLEVLGGPNRTTIVTGPLGVPVRASWRLDELPAGDEARTAVVEMSQAAGLVLAGGPARNDAVAASTAGVGELILAAVAAGARRIVVGCGGSATTDGGAGAVSMLGDGRSLGGAEMMVAYDVDVRFLDAAEQFAPQKGASPEQVRMLSQRLVDLADRYAATFGLDVRSLDGGGAAGGLAGGLAAIGGTLVSGFDLVASLLDLDGHLRTADAVATGEGALDEQSFAGKVVGGVAARCNGRPALCVAGSVRPEAVQAASRRQMSTVSLSDRYGGARAMSEPLELVSDVVAEWLGSLRLSGDAAAG